MPSTDLTLSNKLIHDYFEGSNEYTPISELLYIHTHLIPDNFLSQIERLINMTDELVSNPELKIKPKLVHRISNAAEDLGKLLPNVNETTAPTILELLREIYQACGRILEKYNESGN